MSSMYAMPSPRGTNIEKLYIVRGRGPAGALDAALKRVACDDDDAIAKVQQFLKSKLQPDDYETLEDLVAGVGNGGKADPGEQTGHEDPLPAEDEDEPEANSSLALVAKYGAPQAKAGERVPGGEGLPKELAGDSRRRGRSYAARFPETIRLRSR